MRTSRLFVDAALRAGAEVELDSAQAHYLTRVLRARPGGDVVVFNGRGGEFRARVATAGRRGATLDVLEFEDVERESPLDLTLTLGVARSERMDLAIQKSVELGVRAIQPVFTERSVVSVDGERAERRHAHWLQVARSACEQCGRNRVPALAQPETLAAMLEQRLETLVRDCAQGSGGVALVLSPTASLSLPDVQVQPDNPVQLLIGPEGGLSAAEAAAAASAGYRPVRLGPRVLRTESAVITAVGAAQLLWGDLGSGGEAR